MKRLVWPVAIFATSCGGPMQSAVDASGAPADGIERLWWFFFWLLLTIFVIVIATMSIAIVRRRSTMELEQLKETYRPPQEKEARFRYIVGGATGVTILILFVLIIVSVSAAKSITGPGTKAALTVEVQGNQWWWYIRYPNDQAGRIVVTANEIHIPVGKPVMIRGTSNDVIHSFWAPNLQGKRDLIPSRVTSEWIQADRPGRFRGQCAEFCGLQHAHMAFWVIAQTQEDFEKWYNAQLQPAVAPSNDITKRGQQVFLNSACVMCHNISGTPASGQVGPDLTHVGSRLTIAAGTLPNNPGNLGGWITDPQMIKPGNHMATVPIASEDLQPLIQYLESLK